MTKYFYALILWSPFVVFKNSHERSANWFETRLKVSKKKKNADGGLEIYFFFEITQYVFTLFGFDVEAWWILIDWLWMSSASVDARMCTNWFRQPSNAQYNIYVFVFKTYIYRDLQWQNIKKKTRKTFDRIIVVTGRGKRAPPRLEASGGGTVETFRWIQASLRIILTVGGVVWWYFGSARQ